MSIELLNSIKTETHKLSAEEKAQLADYLLHEAKNASSDDLGLAGENEEEMRTLRMKWLTENREKYAGQYVALVGNRIVGVGKRRLEVVRQARKADAKKAFIVYVYPSDYIGEIGDF